ncbi:MAG: DUF4302 domain-containing protein [Bacteroides sp.]|jgi:hypothetical protein|uniref:DUF4302 domain-containing protein n=1 Tax=Bacteroides sp. TaxID=29523 RepID=UPI0025C40458|nr:DUF4302 domain-containing protein [Bacteroides sp.]MBS6240739.1 DUF4302 domain-containing protein [Bacteroides sp.]
MKKIYYLFCLVAAVLITACTHEEEDLFNDSSANRADATIMANIEVLTGASNGWLMEYFPASSQEYGGYNILLKFTEDGKVTVSSELYASTDAATSYYAVKQSAGILLSFDTYNEIFHLFSDPSDPTGIGGSGYGMEGDYDFLILEATPEKILLKGKKAGGVAVLTPMQGSWSEYISDIQAANDAMIFSKYELEMNGQTIPVTISNRTLTFTYEENGDTKSQTASFILTQTGYKLYEPIVIYEKTLGSFTFDATNELFTETNDNNIKLIPVIPPLNEQFVSGDWFIAYSKLGTYAQTYFSYCKQNYIDAIGEEIVYAFMGSALYGKFGFNFNSSGYGGLLGYDYELIGEDKISLQFNMTGEGDGVWYHNNAGFHYLLNPFGYNSARIFTLTTDNLIKPSYIILTEDSNPNNSMTLSANQINYPFRN